jgi:hypothetical protein
MLCFNLKKLNLGIGNRDSNTYPHPLIGQKFSLSTAGRRELKTKTLSNKGEVGRAMPAFCYRQVAMAMRNSLRLDKSIYPVLPIERLKEMKLFCASGLKPESILEVHSR